MVIIMIMMIMMWVIPREVIDGLLLDIILIFIYRQGECAILLRASRAPRLS